MYSNNENDFKCIRLMKILKYYASHGLKEEFLLNIPFLTFWLRIQYNKIFCILISVKMC